MRDEPLNVSMMIIPISSAEVERVIREHDVIYTQGRYERDWLLSHLPGGIHGLSLVRPEDIWKPRSVLGLFSLHGIFSRINIPTLLSLLSQHQTSLEGPSIL